MCVVKIPQKIFQENSLKFLRDLTFVIFFSFAINSIPLKLNQQQKLHYALETTM